MNVIEGQVPGVKILEPRTFGDPRGFFRETWHIQRYEEAGIPGPFVQDNLSSSAAGVLGDCLQVAPSLQENSCPSPEAPSWILRWTCGWLTHIWTTCDSRTHRRKWKTTVGPSGLCSWIRLLQDDTLVAYKCTAMYDPSAELSIRWDDPGLNLQLPGGPFALSQKDEAAPSLESVMDRLPRYAS